MPTGRLRSIPNPNHVHHHPVVPSRLNTVMSWRSLSNQVDRHITTLKTLRAKLESRLVGMVVARALRLPDVTIYSLPPSRTICS